MPDDLREFSLPDPRPQAAEGPQAVTFAIDPAATALPPAARREPLLDAGPLIVGFAEPDAGPARAEPSPAAAASRRRTWALGISGSLGVHLLPLLLLLYWNGTPAKIVAPIPVTLVLERPPPAPEPPKPKPEPKPEAKPPRGRLASIDIGDPAAKPAKLVDAAEPSADQPEEPKETRVAATAPPRKPLPPPELVSALPKPAAAPEPDLKLPEPAPPAKPPVKQAAAMRPAPHPRRASPLGRIPGPAATEDEYLAYANALIRRYQELIPASLLKGRNGVAVISILVLADGTIERVAVKRSSGYPEIDQRAERMVAAVGRFPPLPRWFQGTSMMLSYHMLFGDRMVLP